MPTVPDIHRRGTRAAQATIAAPPLTVGTLYFVTDEGLTERWNGTAWEAYSGTGLAPVAHTATHQSGGSDPLALDTLAAPTDIATLNASAGAHGLLRKLSGVPTEYLDGNGTWSTPAGGGGFPAAHKLSHENGGADEISVLGLSGLLADGQTPLAHAATHSTGSSDPVTVTALAGFPGGATTFLRADGTFAAPAAGGSGSAFVLAGSGTPHGVLAAALGSHYLDTATGYSYRKLGGAATAFGWYLQPGTLGPTAHGLIASDSASGTPGTIGFQVPSQTNNNTGAGFSDGLYNGSVTNTTAATRGGWFTGAQLYFGDTAFDAVLRFRTGATLTDTRFWFGLSQNDLTNADDTTGNAMMFRFSATTDAGFMGYSRDASVSSLTAMVNAIATNTPYTLRIRFVRTGTPTLYFSVNDGPELAKTTNIPATGIKYGVAFYVYNKNATAQTVYHRSMCIVAGA